MEKYLIWHVQGGLGKNVAATALCKDIKEKYSDRQFILVCSYPEIFLNLPYIDKVYPMDKLTYFYETYIKDKDVIIFKQEPYCQTGHITQENHIIKSWCEILDIEYKNQQPLLIANYAQSSLLSKYYREKPILLLQTTGGGITPPPNYSEVPYSWSRDIPQELAIEITNHYKSTHHIFHITKPSGYILQDVERIDNFLSPMELFSLLVVSKKRILIDSALQHASAALNLPSYVFWIGTSPNVFGYKIHTNIVANKPKIFNQLIYSYDSNFNLAYNDIECPYFSPEDIFNVKETLKVLEYTNKDIILHQNL